MGSSSVKGILVKEVNERQGVRILSLLAALLFLKGIFGKGVKRAAKGVMRAGRGYNNMGDMNKNILVRSFFKAIFSRDSLPRIKDGAYVMYLDDKQSKRAHWGSLIFGRYTAAYFNSFVIDYIPQEVINKIQDTSITHNIFKIQPDDFIMCGFSCIAFIAYMIARKLC